MAQCIRGRNWTFVMYPDSMPKDYKNIMTNLHIPMAVSPCHDKDKNGDETEKKAHYHVVLCFEGMKSYDQVLEITKLFNGTIPQLVGSVSGLIRYFTHMDNPEKKQYDPNLIQVFSGLDINAYMQPTSAVELKIIAEMQQWCFDNMITEYSDLADFALAEHYNDWFPILRCRSLHLQAYITSQRNKFKEEYKKRGSRNE